MQGLPCSNCSGDMVGHSEPQRPVSVSFYTVFYFWYQHCSDDVPKTFHTSRRFFGVVVVVFFHVFETLSSQELLNWPRFSNVTSRYIDSSEEKAKCLRFSSKHLDFDSMLFVRGRYQRRSFDGIPLTWLKSCSHQSYSTLNINHKRRKILVRPLENENFLKNSVCLFSWPGVTANPTRMYKDQRREWTSCEM